MILLTFQKQNKHLVAKFVYTSQKNIKIQMNPINIAQISHTLKELIPQNSSQQQQLYPFCLGVPYNLTISLTRSFAKIKCYFTY